MTYAICCTLNCLDKVFVVKSITNIVHWTYVVEDLIGKFFGIFHEKEFQKINQKSLGLKK